jgi:5-formyltetrahydrofolate cyclo-ligase
MSAGWSIRDYKNHLRAQYKARRRALDPGKKAQMDEKIVTAFTALVSYRYAEILLLYYPRTDEVDIRPLITAALSAGKKVALPRCKNAGQMDFHFIESENDLAPGTFGLTEPKESCPIFDTDHQGKSVLMVVPGLSFDREGYRLGYGKGYYDRYLENRRITCAGLVYADFVTDRLPRGRFDLPVHFIVTEKGVTLID